MKNKVALCFCPLWNPFSINLALPVLNSIIKKRTKIDTKILDYNIDFYRYILSKNFLMESYNKATKYISNFDINSASEFEKKKFDYINQFLSINKKFCKHLINNIEETIKIFNDKDYFYNPKMHIIANIYMTKALYLASLPYYPYIITENYNFDNNTLENTTIKEYLSLNTSDNIFYDFLNDKIEEIITNKHEFVGISVSCHSQMLFALTMSKLLKEKDKNIFIAIGGQYITHTHFEKEDKIVFKFADILLYGDSEDSFLKAIELYKDKKELYKLPNIIFESNNKIIYNPSQKSSITEIPEYCYDGIDFTKYFIPTPVFPIQTSRNCYWGKCTFCNFMHGSTYSQKSATKITDEIQYYTEKYDAKYFYFVDACIHPVLFEELADEIINRKLNIYFIALIRAEHQFDERLLKKLYKAGLRFIATGFESASQRILDKYNKGIKSSNFINYIKAVKSANISLSGTFMVGFPDETNEEIEETFKFIDNNLLYFSNVDINKVMIPKYSILCKNRNDYGIKDSELINMKGLNIYFLKKNIENKELTKKIYYILNKISSTKRALTCKPETELLFLAKYGRNKFEEICNIYDDKLWNINNE